MSAADFDERSVIDHTDRESWLIKAEEDLAEVLELASGLRDRRDDEVLSWLTEHALSAWTAVRQARRVKRTRIDEDEDADIIVEEGSEA